MTEANKAGYDDSTGFVEPRFESVRRLFDEYLRADSGFSAQLAVFQGGELVIDLAGGGHLSNDSLTGMYSATKGVAALTVATA